MTTHRDRPTPTGQSPAYPRLVTQDVSSPRFLAELNKALRDIYDQALRVPPVAGFVCRGDPLAVDKSADWVTGAWTEWDLAGIVPSGANLVLIRFTAVTTGVLGTLYLRRWRYGRGASDARLATQVDTVGYFVDLWVPLGNDRIVEYLASSTTWTVLYATVAGWCVGVS